MTNCEICCADCKQKLTIEDEVCPKCDSKNREIRVADVMRVTCRTKLKNPEFKKPVLEHMDGDSLCHKSGKYHNMERIIDRGKNQYKKIIKDKITGEIIHKCEEPLTNHRGHGSAKNKKSK